VTTSVRRKYRMKLYATEHDIAIPPDFRAAVDGWGEAAIVLLRRIQHHAGIRVTGTWTVATQNLLFPKPLRVRALELARKDLGVGEYPAGSNNNKFTQWWGWGPTAWCVIADSYWYAKAGSKAIIKGKRWAGTDNLLADAKARRYDVHLVADPKPGDIMLIDLEGHVDPDHAGLVEKVGASTVQTIEGNTWAASGGNQAEGGGVFRKTRPRYNCWFIRVEK
jgi:CHAP domain